MARRSKYARQSRKPGAITIARRMPRVVHLSRRDIVQPLTLIPRPIIRRQRYVRSTALSQQHTPTQPARSAGLLGTARIDRQRNTHPTVCRRRLVRRAVLFSRGMAGRGRGHSFNMGRRHRTYRRTSESRLTCK